MIKITTTTGGVVGGVLVVSKDVVSNGTLELT